MLHTTKSRWLKPEKIDAKKTHFCKIDIPRLKASKRALLSFAALMAISNSVFAGLFEYSYHFGDDTSVSGTLTGDVNVNYVENVNNVTLTFNTTTLRQTFYSVGLYNLSWSGDAIVSFDASLNNFLFTDAENYPSSTDYTAFFEIINIPEYNLHRARAYSDSLAVNTSDRPIVSNHWRLTEITSVPEPSSLTLLSFALLIMGIMFKKNRRAIRPKQ